MARVYSEKKHTRRFMRIENALYDGLLAGMA